MSYSTQTWTDNVTKVDAEHLNHMEAGIADGQTHGDVYYGTCSTTYGTATKSVTCENFELFVGAQILVEFSNFSTVDSPSLNVNLTGAKSIYVNGNVTSSTNRFRWSAGAKILFVYDGMGYVPMGYTDGFAGECTTSASSGTKTASVDGFVMTKGVSLTLLMTYANTASTLLLNVSNTGAYSINGYTDWQAGDYVTFVFNGTRYIAQGVNLTDLTTDVQTALTTAQTAQSTAESALSAAQTAQSALEDISATLTQMQEQIDDLDARVTALEGEVVPVYANYFAVYSADDSSLTFYGDDTLPTAGTQYNGKTATEVYADLLDTGTNAPPWNTDWYYMCLRYKTVKFDQTFKQARPVSFYSWFYYFVNVETIEGMENLNSSKATNMGYMFSIGTCSLKSIDLSHLDTSRVTNMARMLQISSPYIATFDLSNFDTSAVTTMSYMFRNCTGLTSLDVSNLDTSAVTNMSSMFYGCSGLTTIYSDDAKFVTAKVTSSSNMFTSCSKLVGGNGTVYSSSKVTADMAHVDTASNPGYFTAK